MPESTITRRNLIEAALEALLEESAKELMIDFQMSTGETLHIEVERRPAAPQSTDDPPLQTAILP